MAVIKLAEAKRGFVRLPRRWVVERSFAWLARFHRLARDYERRPQTLAGLHVGALATLMLTKAVGPSTRSITASKLLFIMLDLRARVGLSGRSRG